MLLPNIHSIRLARPVAQTALVRKSVQQPDRLDKGLLRGHTWTCKEMASQCQIANLKYALDAGCHYVNFIAMVQSAPD